MSFETVVLFAAPAFSLLLTLIYRQVILPKKKAREAQEAALRAFNAELARIDALPKLNTEWLMRCPEKVDHLLKRSYGTRYNRMFIVDEEGNGWVGLATPEVLKSLEIGEYVWSDYYIPFCGRGEAYYGDPVDVEGLTIDIYPVWMRAGVNMPEWQLWAKIERKFARSWGQGTYHSGLTKLNKQMDEIKQRRTELYRLARAAGVQV